MGVVAPDAATEDPGGHRARLTRWLNVASATGPSVAHDGESVLLLSNVSGVPLAYQVAREGGELRPLLGGTERVSEVRAAPGTSRALVCVDRGGDEHWQLHLVPLGGAKAAPPRALTNDPEHIHLAGGWRDDRRFVYSANTRDPRYFDVHELDVEGSGKDRLLVQEDAWMEVGAVRGDRALLHRRNTNLDLDLFLLEGERKLHLNPHEGELTVSGSDLAKDGVYAGANPGRERCALVRYRAGRTNHEFVREYPEGEVELVKADPRGEKLVVSLNRDGWSEVHLLDLATGEETVFRSGPRGVLQGLDWFPDGERIAYGWSSVSEGNEVYTRDVRSGKERRLTRSPVTIPVRLNEPTLGKMRASDGVTVPYWEYLPSTGTPKGTLLRIHGGPEAQERPGFDTVLGFFLEEGWRVVAPNVRGSAGYGRTYVHLDDVRKRMDSVRDVRELAEALVRAGKASRGKLGIFGGSYGGFMVLASLTTYPDLWGAGVDVVGISNFVTFLERTGVWRRHLREVEYGSLEKDREFLDAISPLHRASEIRSPLLVIHGKNDPRVPLYEAEQIVAALEARHRPVELLVFPDEGHGVVRRENRIVAYARAARFLEEHLRARSGD